MSKLIQLSRGLVATVDDADYESLACHSWYAMKGVYCYYAARHAKLVDTDDYGRGVILMHRAIVQPPDGMDVDHRDGNGLNNVRENLRPATRFQNLGNSRKKKNCTSVYKGVSLRLPRLTPGYETKSAHLRKPASWVARIGPVRLGRFDNECDAARAYDHAAVRHYGEFARLNFPEGEQR